MLKLGEFVHYKTKPVLELLGISKQTSNVSWRFRWWFLWRSWKLTQCVSRCGVENNENSQNAQGRRLSLPQTKSNVWNHLRFLKKHFMFLEELYRRIRENGIKVRLSCIYLFQNISRLPDHCHKTNTLSLPSGFSLISNRFPEMCFID